MTCLSRPSLVVGFLFGWLLTDSALVRGWEALEPLPSSSTSTSTSTPSPTQSPSSTTGSTLRPYNYSQEDSVELAYLVTTSYCRNLAGWNCGVACSHTNVSDFVDYEDNSTGIRTLIGRRRDDSCFLAFRGTANVAGVKADVLSTVLVPKAGCYYQGQQCLVSISFQGQYDATAPHLKAALTGLGCDGHPIDIVGHSLGGAIATLAAWDFAVTGYPVRRAYTFGAPRLGDLRFAEAVRQAVTIMRVTRADDPVVLVPWMKDNFVHTGVEVYFTGPVSSGARICYGEDETCSYANHRNFAWNLFFCGFTSFLSWCGHFKYMNAVKEGLMMGSSCSAERRLGEDVPDVFLP